MGRIFYIMGKSSSGKDTVYKGLSESIRLGLKTNIPYTTRPIREGEKNGVEYFFVDEQELERARGNGTLIEVRQYDTCHGVWKYFTVDDGRIDPEKEDYLMIGTLESFVAVRRYYGDQTVIPILIELDDGQRLQRALDRERKQEYPRYEEMCRLFLADARDFAPEKIEAAGITRSFNNDDLSDCIGRIKEYIVSFR